MVDAIFADARLAAVYDVLDPDRRDLVAYVDMVEAFRARSVLDVGCGTGTFACLLASRGIDVVAVDPAGASLDVARGKPGADLVRWVHGDARALPPLVVDAAFMTGNVAQVFLNDDDWLATLRGVRAALRAGGRLVFETRDPARRAWEAWRPDETRRLADHPQAGRVERCEEVLEVSGPFVTFRTLTRFDRDGVLIESMSTLRFRSRAEIDESLSVAGFELLEVRDAPDRPGREWVCVAERPAADEFVD